MKMHWCTGKANLSGQNYTIVVFEKSNAISWPEAQVLMALHGSENIYEIKPCLISDVDLRQEKDRLAAKYGRIVEQVFPGYAPRMETLMPGETEDQLLADAEGNPIQLAGARTPNATNGNGDGPDDEDDDDNGKPADPPSGPAVFKPGKHPPPQKSI